MISVVILTHNDEAIIARTLESVRWCDECIVIDDYSSDTTPELADKYGTVVIQRHLNGNFAAQRNAGLEKAKGDWVLFVDSDEVVSPELQTEIQKVLREDHYNGYILRRTDVMWGRALKHGETAHVALLRLAKKGMGAWARPVHEVWDVRQPVGAISSPLLHYPHPDVAQFLESVNTYSSMNASYLYSMKIHVSGWHIVVYPVAKFLKNYFYLGGFFDGTPGAICAIMMSFHSFLTRAKLYVLWHKKELPVIPAV